LIELALDGWVIKRQSGLDVAADWLAVSCYDCNEETCQGTCNENNRCECNSAERIGLNCEFEIPTCTSYNLDFRTKTSLAGIPEAKLFLETEFAPLTGFGFVAKGDPPLTMNNRLFYVPHPATEAEKDSYLVRSFMFFTGRRWVIFNIPTGTEPPHTFVEFYHMIREIAFNPSYTSVDKLKAITSGKDFEAFVPRFFSTPVDWGTESDGVEPSKVNWVLANKEGSGDNNPMGDYRPNDNLPVNVKLLCSTCISSDDAEQPRDDESSQLCYNDGLCGDNSKCLCSAFYEGTRCEHVRTCMGNEHCYNGGV